MSDNKNSAETVSERKKRLHNARMARYYNNHKDKFCEYRKKTTNCNLCGRPILKGNINKHQQTETCKNAYNYLKQIYNLNKAEGKQSTSSN
jgi:hypothetical protein